MGLDQQKRYQVKRELQVAMQRGQIGKELSKRRVIAAGAAVFIFSSISYASLSFALGYWWVPGSMVIERTGLIQVQSPMTGVPVIVLLNGTKVTDQLPAHLDRLRPQRYTVRIEKDGYTPWERSVAVEPNQRLLFSNVLLIKESREFVLDPTITSEDPRFSASDMRDLEIKNGTEVWFENVLVTRMSTEILSVKWHPLRSYVLIQTRDEMNLVSIDGRSVHTLNTSTDTEQLPIPVFFDRGGRELVVAREAGVFRIELYEATSFIDRLVGFRLEAKP